MSIIMTANKFADIMKYIAENTKTLYVTGGWGAPASERNKERYIKEYAQNSVEPRKTNILNSSADTFFFDCVCLVKGVLWGWTGDIHSANGGAVYKSNGVPDASTEGMLNLCKNVSADFSNIKVGEYLWMKGHAGVYIGNGLAVECTPKWKNKVQITAVWNIGKKNAFNGRSWTKHGELPWLEYEVTKVVPSDVFNKNDIVYFFGSLHYASENAAVGKSAKAGKAKVTLVNYDKKHPYHLVAINDEGKYTSGVYGWVDKETTKMMQNAGIMEMLESKDYVMENVFISAVGKSRNPGIEERAIVKEIDDLYGVVRVKVEGGTAILPKAQLKVIGVTEDELIEAAIRNTESRMVIRNLNEVIRNLMMGGDEPKNLTIDDLVAVSDMYVVSNDSGVHGAGILACTDTLAKIAEKVGGEMYVLPSSIHEVLIVPKTEEHSDAESLNSMVKDVNETQVVPEEQLEDHAYYFNAETKQLVHA